MSEPDPRDPVVPYSQRPAPSPATAGFGVSAAISGLVGVVFLMLGARFGRWLAAVLTGRPFDTQVTWSQGPRTGQPVEYLDLAYGAAWYDAGLFATGVVLVLEAILYGLALMRPTRVRPVLAAIFALAVLGCVANGLSAVMQLRTGFNQPLFAVIGFAVCLMSAFSARQRLREFTPLAV
ncbi:MAG TPA: hypothetical protein VF595_15300 [Tepidisphaeraceae bacterium]|jgi:hypothetical protein